MKNISKSLGCPNCKSSNIEANFTFCDEVNEQTTYYSEDATLSSRRKVYECKCHDCNYKYKVDYGYEKYIVFSKPVAVNCSNDVHLLALYESEMDRNYKIVSINYSSYDKNNNSEETSYFMFIDGEEYPILLSKQTIEEIIKCPDKAHALVMNTHYKRNR